MKTIYKYELDVRSQLTIKLPDRAQVLSVQTQKNVPYIWALGDPNDPDKDRKFSVFGTGNPVCDANKLRFVGTFQLDGGDLVFHLFEHV